MVCLVPKVIITNSTIQISECNEELKKFLKDTLAYKDKSKEYQIRKMQKNVFSMNSPLYKQLVKESSGTLMEFAGDDILIPSGLAYLLKDIPNIKIEDHRKDTGKKISLPWASKTYSLALRDYQEEAVNKAVENWRGIINFATGMGKTKTAIALIRRLKAKTLIVCPSKAIALQFHKELVEAFGPSKVGFIGDGKLKRADLVVGIAASVSNNVEEIKGWELGTIIFDETHHTPANTFYAIASGLSDVGRIYGLTATAYRSDGKDIFIKASCGDILVQKDAKWGIDNGWLASPYFIVRNIPTVAQDFKDDKLKSYRAHVLKSELMNERILNDARAFIKDNKFILILVDQVAHGDMLAKQLDIPFAQGEDKASMDYVDQLNNGQILGLVATDGVVGEGVDTRNVDVLIMANFTASKGAVMQAVGRGLRKTPKKTSCIILDYCPTGSGMLTRHCKQRIAYYREITKNVKVVE